MAVVMDGVLVAFLNDMRCLVFICEVESGIFVGATW